MDNVDVNDTDTAIGSVINAVQNEDAAPEMKVDDEDSDDESDSEDEENIELTEDVMVQLKNNDPNVTKVDIVCDDDDDGIFDATTIDWEKDGCAISENTHLKVLWTNAWQREDVTEIANAKAFCRALSKNRSIKHYYMDGCPLGAEDTFTILTPFFKHNINLRSFTLYGDFGVRHSQVVMLALAECQSLRKVSLNCGADDDVAEYLVSSLGAHLNLREVSLYFRNGNGNGESNGKKWVVALGNILQNHVSKLRTLNLDSNEIWDEGASVLGEALSKNRTLKKLYISSMNSITSFGWAALFRGIANSVSLEEINVSYNKFGDKEALSFAAEYAIARKSSLKSLNMSHLKCAQSITSIGWGTLFRSLLNPSSILEKLDLQDNNITGMSLIVLGDALASSNAKLKILNLAQIQSTAVGWSVFFRSLSNNTNNSLEDVNIGNNSINDEALVALATALSTNLKLKILDLGNNRLISSEGWQTFFTSLQNCNLALKQFSLRGNSISDVVMPSLTNALTNARSLARLNLEGNRAITSVGWVALTNILQRPNSSLIDLTLAYGQNHNINDEVAISFANALINNKSLKTLNVGYSNNNTITARGWSALANVLCNKSSLESIYNSNHTITEACWGDVPHDLASYLRMNENDNKHEVARQKILKYHFADGDENIEKFVEMELAIIPYAIAWMGRDSTGHSLLYNVVRSLPTLFDSDAKAKAVTTAVGTKRKLGC